ncbi:glycosyltransferase family 2 protein [Novosphingobium aquae]|uniref:Glycosyltransferase family 2 protein n=1 Tax=Novosphingobium aquae TaxID=3133435 RepID=A0ABU8S8C2_9SPHN
MKVSIVTAVFNRAQTIEQAIESVTRQTYPDIEHILVDGASSDGTLDAIRRQMKPGMKIVSEPDEGIYYALNKGMQMATGEVIGIVHSDDFLAHDQVIERVALAFSNPHIDAVFGDLDYVKADDTDYVVRHWEAGVFEPKKLKRGWMPPHPALFLRRNVIDILGDYDTFYEIAADYEAVLRWFGKGGIRSAYIPEVLVKMRVGGASNGSIKRIMRKSWEDFHALRRHGVGRCRTLAMKNLRKVKQFVITN